MAPRAPDPHNLRRAASKQAAPIIDTDRQCQSCGYNLRGLRLGINCPECGMSSVLPEGNIDDPLSLMPPRVIVAFIRGCWLASLCVVAMIGLVIASNFPDWKVQYTGIALLAISVLWLGAAMWLTPAFALPQAAIRGFSRASRLRWSARALQLGWVLAAGMVLWQTQLIAPAPGFGAQSVINFGWWFGLMTGLVGLVLLLILLERLAEWARDQDAERMFNWAMWGLPIATPLLLADVGHPVAKLFILVVWLALACAFPYGMLSLSKSVTLSILHSKENEDRLRRRDERTKKYHGKVADTVARMDASRAQAAKPTPANQPAKPRQTPTKP